MSLSFRIHQRRKLLKLTQEELAARTGLSYSSIQKYETGAVKPTRNSAYKLAMGLQVGVDWLLTGESKSGFDKITDNQPAFGKEETVDIDGKPLPLIIYDPAKQPGASPNAGLTREERALKYGIPMDDGPMYEHPPQYYEQNPDYDWTPATDADGPLPPPELPPWEPPSNMDEFSCVPLAEQFLSAGGGAYILSEERGIPHAFRKNWLHRKTNNVNNLILIQVRGSSMEPTIKNGDVVMVDRGRQSLISDHIYAIGLDDTVLVKRIKRLGGDRIKLSSDNPDHQPIHVSINNIRVVGQVVWLAREIA